MKNNSSKCSLPQKLNRLEVPIANTKSDSRIHEDIDVQ